MCSEIFFSKRLLVHSMQVSRTEELNLVSYELCIGSYAFFKLFGVHFLAGYMNYNWVRVVLLFP